MEIPNYLGLINIPAYDSNYRGLVVQFKLVPYLKGKLNISTHGSASFALRRNFLRTIDIMAALNSSWEILKNFDYILSCDNHSLGKIKDTKSSSMSLCIALVNLARVIRGQSEIIRLTGTGMLRMDGTFDHASREEEKYTATKNSINNLKNFITPQQCRHVLHLDRYMEQFN